VKPCRLGALLGYLAYAIAQRRALQTKALVPVGLRVLGSGSLKFLEVTEENAVMSGSDAYRPFVDRLHDSVILAHASEMV
jgi:hypothetical protein